MAMMAIYHEIIGEVSGIPLSRAASCISWDHQLLSSLLACLALPCPI